MKKVCLVLVVAVLLAGLVSPVLAADKKDKIIETKLVDVKLDIKERVFILYLLDYKAIKVVYDGLIIRYDRSGMVVDPVVQVDTSKSNTYTGYTYPYKEITVTFKNRQQYLEYFGHFKIFKTD